MNMVVGLAIAYIIGMPILLRLIALAHKKLITERAINKMREQKKNLNNAPEPIWNTWKTHIGFTMKDKRALKNAKPAAKEGKEDAEPTKSISRKAFFYILWLVGLLLVIIGAFANIVPIIIIGNLMFFADMIYGVQSAKKLLKARKNIQARMFDIARTKLGQSMEFARNPSEIIRVTEWNDYIKPQKVEFDVPTEFNGESGEEGFLKQFNQVFGRETAWVPSDNPETHEPGWDYERGVVTIHAVPPLPQSAGWDEHYVLAEGVAWSFFPIGLGVENGIELLNPETGVTENVLGFDLSGEQAGIGKKAGIKVSPTITTSPMVFVGGGTGGGKSLASETLVEVFSEFSETQHS